MRDECGIKSPPGLDATENKDTKKLHPKVPAIKNRIR